MKKCPDCGRELSSHESYCPSCKKKIKSPFTIRNFLWEHFRFFTMIGLTGTMISLIPTMGERILGAYWITDPNSFLPLFLSIIIFFGASFLTICFLMIFSLIFEGRDTENARATINFRSKTLISWYEGDFQRFLLLFCLVPMWSGLLLFFILLMPLIPNKYSWMFAAIIGLTCIPLFILSCAGWTLGKGIIGIIPGMNKYPRLGTVLFALVVIGFIVLVPLAVSEFSGSKENFSGDMKIRPDPQYFSPQISTVPGLRLAVTNVSEHTLQASRFTWSADYGYFIRVIPSTSEVIILGNPVSDDNARDIYWTYSGSDVDPDKKPVKIDVHLYSVQGNQEIAHSALYLTWYTNDIVYANRSFVPSP